MSEHPCISCGAERPDQSVGSQCPHCGHVEPPEDYETIGCAGPSAHGDCEATVRYVVTVRKRPDMFTCGRHLSWLVDHRTVPGGSVTVTKLKNRPGHGA